MFVHVMYICSISDKLKLKSIRALTQDLDIHDFDEYLRNKYSNNLQNSQSKLKASDQHIHIAPEPSVAGPYPASTTNNTAPVSATPVSIKARSATDALLATHDISEVNHIAQAVKVKLDHRFVSLHEAFQKLDVKNTGSISRQEFLDVS